MPAFPTLETERLRLRAPQPDDLPGFAELLGDPTTHPYVSDAGPVPAEAVPARLAAFAAGFESGDSIHWTLELRDDRVFAGYVALHRLREASPQLSYAIVPRLRRQGLATEALRAVLASPPASRRVGIIARIHDDNSASRKLLHGLGFDEHGTVATEHGARIEYRRSRRILDR